MAFTQADVDALKAAIATGAREVRYADGRLVTYRSIAEMNSILLMMQNDVSGRQRTLADDRVVSGYNSGLSRGTPIYGPGYGGPDRGGCW